MRIWKPVARDRDVVDEGRRGVEVLRTRFERTLARGARVRYRGLSRFDVSAPDAPTT